MVDSDLLTIGGVAVVLLGMLLVNMLLGRKELRQEGDDESAPSDTLLCKFVVHDGSVVGESVAEDGAHLVLKQAGVFRAVPLGQVRPEGAELRLTGQVDWAEAERLGAAWHERVKGEGSDEVAGAMTRSQDVRAPARAAFEQRGLGVAGTGAADTAERAGADGSAEEEVPGPDRAPQGDAEE